MNTKTRIGFLIIMAAALFSVSAFVLWPSLIRGQSAPKTPEQVVEDFYQEYLEYTGESGTESFRNPLADRIYQESGLLTSSFKAHLDDLLAAEEAPRADPLLCAQDIPQELRIQELYQQGQQAQAVVRTDFAGHVFTVDLRQEGDSWLIASVTCGGTPEGQAKAFYAWYLGSIGDPSGEENTSPLAERSYRSSQFLSPAFSTAVDDLLEGTSRGGYDPFLLAQDIPSSFSVDPGLSEDTAVVHLQFGEKSVKHLKVTFVREKGSLLIDGIKEDTR